MQKKVLQGASQVHAILIYFIIYNSVAVPGNFHHHCRLILMQVASPPSGQSELHPAPPALALAITYT